MEVRINGKLVDLETPTPLLDYLAQIGVDPRTVAVEHNGEILERAGYERAVNNSGDVVEIVRMVGGG